MAKRILVVEDDGMVRSQMVRALTSADYDVVEAANGSELRALLTAAPIHLITLDLTLPDEDGLELARELIKNHDIPIVMVTGRRGMEAEIIGLELGADDYIAKPFDVQLFVARVRTVLRRYEPRQADAVRHNATTSARFRFADFILDIRQRELSTVAGDLVALTTAEFNLLELFVAHANSVLTRAQIMDLIKGEEWDTFDRAIDLQVSRLRKKIEVQPNQPRLIKTVRNSGYYFAVDVTRIADQPAKV